MQSIIFGIVWIVFSIVCSIAHAIFSHIPAIGFFFDVLLSVIWALVWVAFLVVFIITIVKAFTGVRWDIPYIGPIARKQIEVSAP